MPTDSMLERFQIVGCLVRAVRNLNGSNPKSFAFRVGCRNSHFGKIESNKRSSFDRRKWIRQGVERVVDFFLLGAFHFRETDLRE